MAKTQNSLTSIYKKYLTRVDSLIKSDKKAGDFFRLLETTSESEFTAIARQEIKVFDEKWIDNIQNWLGAIERIIKDPKKHIKSVGVLTPVELARKTSSESIIHLSSHSQYVKTIDDEGNIIPDKVLNIEAEDNYAIYENRFIKTLIEKLLIFVERRYEFISKHADTRDTDLVLVKNKFTIGETIYEVESKVKISIPSLDEGKKEYNQSLLNRIDEIRRMIRFYSESDLMKKLKDAKPVFAPIQQTNIIRKNKDYNACYQLFKFLDTYDKFGISIRVKEAKKEFDNDYIKKLYYQIMFAELALESDKIPTADLSKVKGRKIQPKINKIKIKDPNFNDNRFGIDIGYIEKSKEEIAKEKARLKALKEKEEAKKRRLEKQKREKERQAKLKEEARLRKIAEKEKEKERARRAKELKKQREKEAKLREQERLEKAEQRKKEMEIIIEARRKVAEAARKEKEKNRAKEEALEQEERERELLLRQKEKEEMEALKAQQEEELRKQRALEKERLKEERALKRKQEKEEKARLLAEQKRLEEEERLRKAKEEEERKIFEEKQRAELERLQKEAEEKRRIFEEERKKQEEIKRKEEAERRKRLEEERKLLQERREAEERRKALFAYDQAKLKRLRAARVAKQNIHSKITSDKIENVKKVNKKNDNISIGE